jgi:excisionase family DNA binding protein
MNTGEALASLEQVARELESRGATDLAERLHAAIACLREQMPAGPEQQIASGVLTTGEAARLLGVGSLNTIKAWARQGLLDGYQRGGRVVVTRDSVERLLHSRPLAAEQSYERELAEVLRELDFAADPGILKA